jgi:uncharacterized Zn-finger protein
MLVAIPLKLINFTFKRDNNKMQHENKQKLIEITKNNLPLCCPMPDMVSWDSHPRVFLEIEKEPNGEIICPYCSTKYILK